MSQRVRLTIAYDGARFRGWQSQAGGGTIQDLLELAAGGICKHPVTIHGAGRTDAGVHALGQSAHFDSPDLTLDPAAWRRAFNANLPPEIRVIRASAVSKDFHARFSAKGKVYRYEIATGAVLMPGDFRRAWHVPMPMDLDRMDAALALFEGVHDFRAFAANRSQPVDNTIRHVFRIRRTSRGGTIRIKFDGEGFLYKMVRMLVGAAVRVARGREELDWITSLLENPNGPKCAHVAPADGLTLVRVRYR